MTIPDKAARDVQLDTVAGRPDLSVFKQVQNDRLPFGHRQEFQLNVHKALARNNGRIYRWQGHRFFVGNEKTRIAPHALDGPRQGKKD